MRALPVPSRPRWARLALFLLAVLAVPAAALGDDPKLGKVKVRVKGSSRVQISAWSGGDEFVVHGSVEDDAGDPAPGEIVQLDLPVDQLSGCTAATTVSREGGLFRVKTDEHGAFCVRGKGSLSPDEISAKFPGTALLEPSTEKARVDRSPKRPPPATLSFDPGPDSIDLDQATVAVVGVLRLERDPILGDSAPRKREGHLVRLTDERGVALAEQVTAGDGRVRFEVKTSALAGPGLGELRLTMGPGAGLAARTALHPVMRKASARLSAPKVDGVPDQGVTIPVEVAWAHGPVEGGTVEALFGGASAGAAPVEKGRCTLTATFAPPRGDSAKLTLRYLPAAPYFVAGPPLEVRVSVVPPPLWPQIVVGAIVLLTAGWVVWGWRRAPRKQDEKEPMSLPPPSGRAGVQVLAAAEGTSWTGVVHDAHEGTVIPGATVRVVVASFQGELVAVEVVTDERGEFSFSWGSPDVRPGDARLRVDSTWHSAHEDGLPPPSRLSISLVTRRRALLERLVRWAKARGTPYDGPVEPTPGHVRRVANRGGADEVETWARAVEDAAFGPLPVDRDVEAAARGREPSAAKVIAPPEPPPPPPPPPKPG